MQVFGAVGIHAQTLSVAGITETCNLAAIKSGYYHRCHVSIRPAFCRRGQTWLAEEPHGRARSLERLTAI